MACGRRYQEGADSAIYYVLMGVQQLTYLCMRTYCTGAHLARQLNGTIMACFHKCSILIQIGQKLGRKSAELYQRYHALYSQYMGISYLD